MTQLAGTTPADPGAGTNHYDVVVVGTSPMCMIAALAERADGKRVLVVDGADEVGGTWKTTELLGYSNVELGCHELDAIHPVYDLLEDMGIPMGVMNPQPVYVSVEPRYFPRTLPYHHRWLRELHDVLTGRNNLDLHWVNSRSLASRARAVLRVGRQAARAFRGTNRPAKYPPNGAMDIVRRLDAMARDAGVEVRCSTWLSDVEIDRKSNQVRFMMNGEAATAGFMHITSSTNVGPIRDEGAEVELDPADACWQTLYLSLRDCPKPPFTYIVFTNPSLLHRASDLSRYAVPDDAVPNSRLIALTIDETSPETEEVAVEALRQMKALQLINAEARLEGFTYLPYEFTRVSEWKRKEINQRLAPLVTLHETTLLTPSINNLMKRPSFRKFVAHLPAPVRGAAGTET